MTKLDSYSQEMYDLLVKLWDNGKGPCDIGELLDKITHEPKPLIPFHMECRYCGVSDEETDIYIVMKNGKFEGFCLPCYEKHLDDKRKPVSEQPLPYYYQPLAEQPIPIPNSICPICGADLSKGEQCCLTAHCCDEDRKHGGSGVAHVSCPCPRCTPRC